MNRLSKYLNIIVFICVFAIFLAGITLRIATAEGMSYWLAFLTALLCVAAVLFFAGKIKLRERFIKRNYKWQVCLAVLAGVCFAVKLIWVLVFRIKPTVDYSTFYDTALAFAGDGPFNVLYLSLFPHIMGYSWFLSGFFRIFGSGFLVAPVVNVVLSVFSGMMIFRLLRSNAGLYEACTGFALWIICPSGTLYNTMTLSEPYYTCLIFAVLCILDYMCSIVDGSIIAGIFCGCLSGVLLALINAARPIGAVFIIAFFIWYLLLRGKKSFTKMNIKVFFPYAVFMLAVYLLAGSAWSAKINNILGTEVSSFPGYSVYTGFDTETYGTYDGSAMQLLTDIAVSEGSEAAQQKMLEMAKENILSGNINFAKLLKNKLIAFLGNDEGGAYYSIEWLKPRQYSFLAFMSNIFYYALVIVLAIKVIIRIKGLKTINAQNEGGIVEYALLSALGIIIAQMLVEVAGRYHYALIPIIIMLVCSFRRV